MERHEVVNQIIDYLEVRKLELEDEMKVTSEDSRVYDYLEGSFETYDHLIAKLEDDYRAG
jgi:hypothetical protein